MQETRGPTFVTGYEHLTLAQRLLRVLHAPRSAYQAIGDEPSGLDWFIPIIILAVIWIGSNYLTLSVLAINFIGDGLRDALDPRMTLD